jgi:hypothetical protein
MKKLLNIFVAVLTSIIGVSVYYALFFFIPASVAEIKETTTFDEIEMHPQSYLSRKIVLQEDLIAYRDKGYNSLSYHIQGHKKKCDIRVSCSNVEYLDCMIGNSLEFKTWVGQNEVSLIEEIAEKNRQHYENGSRKGLFGAKVEITGYISDAVDFVDYSPFGNYFTINVIDIKQISPIRFISEEEMNKPK